MRTAVSLEKIGEDINLERAIPWSVATLCLWHNFGAWERSERQAERSDRPAAYPAAPNWTERVLCDG